MFTAIYTKLYFINQLSLEAENLPSPCKGVPTKTIYLNKVWYIVYRKFSNVVFEQSFSFINREKMDRLSLQRLCDIDIIRSVSVFIEWNEMWYLL